MNFRFYLFSKSSRMSLESYSEVLLLICQGNFDIFKSIATKTFNGVMRRAFTR